MEHQLQADALPGFWRLQGVVPTQLCAGIYLKTRFFFFRALQGVSGASYNTCCFIPGAASELLIQMRDEARLLFYFRKGVDRRNAYIYAKPPGERRYSPRTFEEVSSDHLGLQHLQSSRALAMQLSAIEKEKGLEEEGTRRRDIFIKATSNGHFVKASPSGRCSKANGQFVKANGHFIKGLAGSNAGPASCLRRVEHADSSQRPSNVSCGCSGKPAPLLQLKKRSPHFP